MKIKDLRIKVAGILLLILGMLLTCMTALCVTLPPSFDLRDIDGHSYIGPVRDQGQCGACDAFAALAAAESTWNRAHDLSDAQVIDLSEAFMIWDLSPLYDGLYGCNGGYRWDAMTSLVDYGVPLEKDFPYTSTYPGANLHWDAPRYTFLDWYPIPPNDIETTKRVLDSIGAVWETVNSQNFWYYQGGIYQDNYNIPSYVDLSAPIDHAVALIGWNDTPGDGGMGTWILRNSWGTGWGEDGYMQIRYTSAESNLQGAYLIASPWSGKSTAMKNNGTINAVPWSAGGTLNAHGVDLWGGAASSVMNRGTIIAQAYAQDELSTARGVYLWGGPDGYVLNEGRIASFAGSLTNQAIAYAICLQGGLVDNRNMMEAQAESDSSLAMALGVWASNGGNPLEVENSGNISAWAKQGISRIAYGVYGYSRSQVKVLNSGKISAYANDMAVGVLLTGGPALLENSGTIQAAGSVSTLSTGKSYGVVAVRKALIVNSGIISGKTASVYGANLYGGNQVTLELKTGSDLEGPVILSGSDDRVILTGTGSEDQTFKGVETLVMDYGDWSLSGPSTFNTIQINQGRLGIDGALAGETEISPGGILGGNGILSGNVTNNGEVVPGDSVGHLTIQGNFSQASDGILQIETGNHDADRLTVTGTADLAGTLIVLPNGYASGGNYTFLDTGTLTGEFDHLQSVAVLRAIVYSNRPGELAMDVFRNSYSSLATNYNMSLAGILDSLRPEAAGDMGDLLDQLDFAPNQSDLNNEMTSLTPRIHGLASAVLLNDSQTQLENLNRHLEKINHISFLDKEPEGKTSLWVDIMGGRTRYRADDGYFGARETLYGPMIGVERMVRDGLTLGVATAFTKSRYDSLDTGDKGLSQSEQGYCYGSWHDPLRTDGFQLAATLGVGITQLHADRYIPFVDRKAQSDHEGRLFSASLQGRYDWTLEGWTLGPVMGTRYVHLREEGFREWGADSADLEVGPRDNDSLQGLMGVRLERQLSVAGIVWEPSLRADWYKEFDRNSSDLKSKLAGGGDYFLTPGRDLPGEGVLLGIDLKMRLSRRVFGAFSYDCKMQSHGDAGSQSLGLQIAMTF